MDAGPLRGALVLAALAAAACTPSPAPSAAPAATATGTAKSSPEPPAVSIAKPPPQLFASVSARPAPPPQAKPAGEGSDAGACAPLQGPDIVMRGSNKNVEAKTPAECTRCKGDWGRHGLVGAVGCLCRTPDGGKPCESPHDCSAECMLDPDRARALSNKCPAVGAKLHGHCATRYTTFGCNGFVVEKPTPAGPLRGVLYICLD